MYIYTCACIICVIYLQNLDKAISKIFDPATCSPDKAKRQDFTGQSVPGRADRVDPQVQYSLNFLNNPCCMVIVQMAFWSFMLPIPCKSIGCWRALVKPSISLCSYRICAGPEGGAQSFPKNYNMTIGVDFLVKRVSCLGR